jgi:Cd2+/Zn2+-exporting ATPase
LRTLSAAVMILYALGGYFEDLATEKTRRSVKGLLDLTPDRAVVVEGTSTTVKNPEDVKVGEVILVKPGERVPIDGIIVEGATSLNTSALTGESLPKAAEPGDFVMSGVINISSPIKLKVENTYSDSTVAKMLRLLDGAANSKAPAERFISRFARVYTPIVVLISALTAFVPPLLGLGSFSTWGYRALVLLVVSCPCALVISVPLSYFSGMGRASQLGLLVKSGEVLDRLKDVDTAVWDKTGTLTSGDFEVVAVRPENGVNEAELLALAASVEQYFTHPLAAAITKKAKEGGIKLMEAQDLEEIPGKGVTGTVSGQKVFAGSLGYLRSMFPQLSLDNQTSATAVGVVTAGSSPELLGILELTDALKPSTKSAISSLKNLGLANIVLTGDRKSSADSALTGLDLDAVEAELLPEDKLKYVDMLKQTKKPMFIGDGVNDVPVLASAYVGVAMGGIGSDAAIEVSDVILVTDEPKKVPLLIKLARAVQGKVAVNIGLALGIKLLVIALSIFGLSGMWQAIVADVGVTLVAILNAASLFTKFKNA